MAENQRRLTKTGVSLLTVAYVSVSSTNKTFDNQKHICEENVKDWRRLNERVKEVGGRVCAQLHHPGLFCMSSTGRPMGPSWFFLPSKLAWPHVITKSELDEIKAQYVEAAKLCVEAGFSALELHCGHGYLLSQFLTPMINRRGDGYGGYWSIEGRARFPAEVLRAIRSACPEDVPIFVKMNADDGLPFGGLKIDEALKAATMFAKAGADAIIPSFGYTSLNGFGMLRGSVPLAQMAESLPGGVRWIVRWFGRFLVPQIKYESNFMQHLTQRFVDALRDTDTHVIYVGGCDSLSAVRDVLGMGCPAVQLARPLIREPWFVRKLERAAKLGENAHSTCSRCNQCTLAAIDPVRFSGGCVELLPGEGQDFEVDADIEDVRSTGVLSGKQ
eukprot:TRINITY_DN122997_c0_g1_i1.p1 TRINITY_DN122997_c0_g1~~TRINITY_DN122997_c0_g1_i1.p1  ORF type:complete len:443 (+),score=60.83 TRINITY_DN122997_c0_g1_i1:170-1330(+)